MWDCFILPLQPPWRRKEFPIDIHLSKIGNKNENPIALSCIAEDYIASHSNQLHIHCESKKLCHFYFYYNFGKCWSIFKILSMSESERNGS